MHLYHFLDSRFRGNDTPLRGRRFQNGCFGTAVLGHLMYTGCFETAAGRRDGRLAREESERLVGEERLGRGGPEWLSGSFHMTI